MLKDAKFQANSRYSRRRIQPLTQNLVGDISLQKCCGQENSIRISEYLKKNESRSMRPSFIREFGFSKSGLETINNL